MENDEEKIFEQSDDWPNDNKRPRPRPDSPKNSVSKDRQGSAEKERRVGELQPQGPNQNEDKFSTETPGEAGLPKEASSCRDFMETSGKKSGGGITCCVLPCYNNSKRNCNFCHSQRCCTEEKMVSDDKQEELCSVHVS